MEHKRHSTMRTSNMICANCGAGVTTETERTGSLAIPVCRECGLMLGGPEQAHEQRGFLARLSRFGLGARSRPLFRGKHLESPQ